ncbi:hypothetical protein N7540_008555 [Penicillium herquei]|nr:hypothetical protein N7540_008555 [Penicillium herquei]
MKDAVPHYFIREPATSVVLKSRGSLNHPYHVTLLNSTTCSSTARCGGAVVRWYRGPNLDDASTPRGGGARWRGDAVVSRPTPQQVSPLPLAAVVRWASTR